MAAGGCLSRARAAPDSASPSRIGRWITAESLRRGLLCGTGRGQAVADMRILALDTALNACSACVFDTQGGELASESEPMLRGHAEALIPMVARVVARTEGFEAIDRIATTVGPGSFTGLRVAISAARAFALSLDRPSVGLSPLAAIAAPHIIDEDGQAVGAAIDARHGQI